jgi:hypothetical protein
MLCKHFSSSKGCSFGDKCNFAHGVGDIRSSNGVVAAQQSLSPSNNASQSKKGLNAQNYKIVKCKYFEKDGSCRYGSLCTFAHGDEDLRTKSDNIMATQAQLSNPMFNPLAMGMNNPMLMNMNMKMQQSPYMVDPQMMMMDPNVMMNMNMNMNNPMLMNMGMRIGSTNGGSSNGNQPSQNNNTSKPEL